MILGVYQFIKTTNFRIMKKKKIEENEPLSTEGIIAPIQSERETRAEFYRKLGIPNRTHEMIGKTRISFTTFSTPKEDTPLSE